MRADHAGQNTLGAHASHNPGLRRGKADTGSTMSHLGNVFLSATFLNELVHVREQVHGRAGIKARPSADLQPERVRLGLT
eukprot:scaffold803_cov310-Pinguiococcus_pyrenoidosus.AAC.169